MSKFNPDQFLSTVYDQAGSTKPVAIPEGTYPGVCKKVNVRAVKSQDGDQQILDLTFELTDTDGRIQAETGREKNYARYSAWLDITPEGNLDMGKGMNVGLNRVRDAFGMNKDGQPWNANMFLGQACLCQVVQRADKETGDLYSDIKSVTSL